jgi:hypothetical protein
MHDDNAFDAHLRMEDLENDLVGTFMPHFVHSHVRGDSYGRHSNAGVWPSIPECLSICQRYECSNSYDKLFNEHQFTVW